MESSEKRGSVIKRRGKGKYFFSPESWMAKKKEVGRPRRAQLTVVMHGAER